MPQHVMTDRSAPSPASPLGPMPTAEPATSSGTPSGAPPETPKKTIELSVTQLVGGALAAMTAAALGSRLGLAGTVIGAAVASLVAGIGGALYTASIRRTRDRVRTVWQGRSPVPVETTRIHPGVAAAVRPLGVAAAVSPDWSVPTGGVRGSAKSRRLWPRVLAATVASFVLAAAGLTTVELLTGHALSGGSGTTVQQVQSGGEPGASAPDVSQAPKPTPDDSPTATPSESASESNPATTPPSPEPTPSATDAPTPSPTESAAPDPSATAPTTDGASAAPTDSASVQAADGDRTEGTTVDTPGS